MKQIAIESPKTLSRVYTYSWVATMFTTGVFLVVSVICLLQGIVFSSTVGAISYVVSLLLADRCFMRLWTDALNRELRPKKWSLDNTMSGSVWRFLLVTSFFDGILDILLLFACVRVGFNMSFALMALLGGKMISLVFRFFLSENLHTRWNTLATWIGLVILISVFYFIESQLNSNLVLCAIAAKGLLGETATSDRYYWAAQKKMVVIN